MLSAWAGRVVLIDLLNAGRHCIERRAGLGYWKRPFRARAGIILHMTIVGWFRLLRDDTLV
jgi:hypothetical protein